LQTVWRTIRLRINNVAFKVEVAAMNKAEYREAFRALLTEQVADLTLDDKLAIAQQCWIDAQKAAEFDEGNKGKPWTDEELRVVLQHAPTRENCMLLARAFRRGYGSIEEIVRWAATSDTDVEAGRPDNAFIQQIKRVAKQVGWKATGRVASANDPRQPTPAARSLSEVRS